MRATGPRTGQLQRVVGSRFVFCGRLGDCNALVGHSLADDGAAKEDTASRACSSSCSASAMSSSC